MSPYVTEEVINEILGKVCIVEFISKYIKLKKAGRNFKAICPFHKGKTPTFFVDGKKQIFHCFECGAGGSVITFLMKYENLEFPQALKKLADKVGITLSDEASSGM